MATAIAAGPLPLCPIASLPPELQISICAHLSPRSLVALAACSSTLAAVCLSHSVLREVLIDALGIEPQGALRDHLEFVLTMKARTGWFLSSRAYTSRLINVRIEWAAGNHQPALIADEIDPGNGYALDSEDPLRAPAPPVLPLGCVMDLEGASYTVPRWGPGSNQPDRGLSVDLLLPVYDAYPLFSVTSSASRWNAAEPASTHNARIHLKSITRPLLPPVPDTEETRSDTLFGLWTGRSPIQTRNWPSRELIGSRNADLYFQGPALALGDWVGERGAIVGDERAIELVDGALPGFQVQIVKSATPVVEADRAQPGLTTRVQRQFPDNAQDARFVRDEGAQPEGVGLFRLQGRLGARLSTLPREEEDVVNGEVIKGPTEQFFRIRAPAGQISWRDAKSRDPVEKEITVASLQGLWLGTYGGHGLEYCYISVKVESLFGNGNSAYGDVLLSSSSTASTAAFIPEGRYRKSLVCVKLTGDTNVPSSEASWSCDLGEFDIDVKTRFEEIKLGVLPTVENATLLARSRDLSRGPRAEDEGLPGFGRIAMAGFIQPSWTPATLTFIRSTHSVPLPSTRSRDSASTSDVEMADVQLCDEIRLRWAELGKVGSFKRVRIS